jgi:hypothetical protein
MIPDDQFLGPLVSIKNQLNDLDDLKTFFFTLVSLSAGKKEIEGRAIMELSTSLLYDIGIKLDCVVDKIFYQLSPKYEESRKKYPEGPGEAT